MRQVQIVNLDISVLDMGVMYFYGLGLIPKHCMTVLALLTI